MRGQLIQKSTNVKTGAIATSNSSSETCPDACPLKRGGCYAKSHPYIKSNWDKLDRGERGVIWSKFLKEVRQINPGALWRHNVAGDLPGRNNKIDKNKLYSLVDANKGKRGFTYTHKPVWKHFEAKNNLQAITYANRKGFTVNLSANTIEEAIFYKSKWNLPVTSLVEEDYSQKTKVLEDGLKLIVCPAVTHDNVTCKSCGLCQKRNRDSIILFPAHGKQKRQTSLIARG